MAAAAATTTPAPEYDKLTKLLREISSLAGAQGVLVWDEMVMLPKGSAADRAEQKAVLAAVIHEKSTSDELAAAIAAAEGVSCGLNEYAKANVRDARRSYDQTVRVPRELVMERERAESNGYAAWVEAKKASDWQKFAPVMREGLRVFKQYVSASRPDMEPYDAAIDTFERGMTVRRLQELFDELAPPLKRLLDDVARARANMPPVADALRGGAGWEVDKQTKFSRVVAEMLTFDFDKGRIDVSQHPFTGGSGPDDTRITTRYSTNNPFEGIMGTIHESGHALYEQGRGGEQKGLPVAEPLSMGAHESQSLFWERMIGLSTPFWSAVLPTLHEQLPVTKDCTAEDVAYAVNQVNKEGLIRVDADELSYPFHIILRFEIERGLFDGSIDVDDLPTIWNQKMKQYFDVDVPDVARGCLQDVHWPSLGYGYFPSYTLGAMAAAQLYAHMDAVGLPGMEERIARGAFGEIKEYLNREFHRVGSLYTSLDDLLVSITGEPLKVRYFIEYLTKKYSKMYGLE